MRTRAALLGIAILTGTASDAVAQLQAQQYATGLSAPVHFVQDPTDTEVQFVVQQGGVIRAIRNGTVQPTPFLDLTPLVSSGGERGLFSMALDPAYASTRRFWVNYTNLDGHTVVARYQRSVGDPMVADPSTRKDLVWEPGQAFIVQPGSNHNGGNIAFGPDGFLYIGMGDGGGANDTAHLAQNPNSLHGKMLRIDVDVSDSDPEGFDIPASNPFIDGTPIAAHGAIWAFGLRNPWKFSFDSQTGALIIADVGQARWEEINYQPPGVGARNYGWRNYEGSRANVQSLPLAYLPPAMPVYEYDHSEGVSITGGFVYRGTAMHSSWRGRYFFADFGFGRVWSLRFVVHPTTGEATATDLREHTAELTATVGALGSLSAFGVDATGELYVVGHQLGRVIRIVSTGPAPAAQLTPAADFNEDLLPDIVWQHDTQRYIAAWFMTNTTLIDSVLTNPNSEPDTEWKIVGAPLINRDFKSDIVWQHQSLGYVALWYMNGRHLLESVLFEPPRVPDPNWKIVASGDMNGDGRTDLVWRQVSSGVIAVWLLDGIRLIDSVLLNPSSVDPAWNIVGTGDFNADGKADIVWHHPTQGHVAVWLMNGLTLIASVSPSVNRVADTNWVIAGVWDPNRDGHADILWQHRGDGYVATWLMNGITVTDSVLLSPGRVTDTGWRIAGPR